jgi:hypothetical protein
MIIVRFAMSQWFYYEGDEIKGPVSIDELISHLNAHGLDVSVWTQGFSEWEKAYTIPDLVAWSSPPPFPEEIPAPKTPRSWVVVQVLIALLILSLLVYFATLSSR